MDTKEFGNENQPKLMNKEDNFKVISEDKIKYNP
jgi:hypothetical protein